MGGLLTTIGQLGRATERVIVERLDRRRYPKLTRAALVAACRADRDIGNHLLPRLISKLKTLENSNLNSRDVTTLMKALVRHGERDMVRPFENDSNPRIRRAAGSALQLTRSSSPQACNK